MFIFIVIVECIVLWFLNGWQAKKCFETYYACVGQISGTIYMAIKWMSARYKALQKIIERKRKSQRERERGREDEGTMLNKQFQISDRHSIVFTCTLFLLKRYLNAAYYSIQLTNFAFCVRNAMHIIWKRFFFSFWLVTFFSSSFIRYGGARAAGKKSHDAYF